MNGNDDSLIDLFEMNEKGKDGIMELQCSLEGMYLSQPGYSYLVKVDSFFYEDLFNLFGLFKSTVDVKRCLHYIFTKRDYYSDVEDDDEIDRIETKINNLYKQIHQRYVLTEGGMKQIYCRYMRAEFGKCPCYRCQNTPLLPTGLSDENNVEPLKLFCPCCKEIYNTQPPYNIDGSFFGKSFAPLFFLTYKIHPVSLPKYEPSLFGFKIHPSSPFYNHLNCIVCCHYFSTLEMNSQEQYDELYNHMKTLLAEESPDHDEVKTCAGSILSLHRSFPPDLRFRIWEVLMDVSEREEPDFEMMTKIQAKFDNDDVLIQDVNRSFNTVEEPRRSELQKQLTMVISTYCAKYEVAYWQGMHDIIAAILLIEPQPPLDRIFLLFSAFLQTFIPNPVNDNDCILLKHLFEMIRLLLQYHDPQLSLHLEKNNITPIMYSMSLILTMFAHDVCHPLLLSIWDQYIFYKNPTIHVFSVVSHLITNKPHILAYPTSELLNFITHLPFENDELSMIQRIRNPMPSPSDVGDDSIVLSLQEELNHRKNDPTIITDLVAGGIRLMQNTPPGFIHRLNNILNDKVTISEQSLESYSKAPCVMSSPAEIITYLVRGVEKNVNCLHYLLLDTRPYAVYKKYHLTNSKNVTDKTLINLEKIDLLVRKARDHGSHIVILTTNREKEEEDVCIQLVEILVKRGCRYVSQVIGGFDRILKLLKQDDSIRMDELLTVDVDAKTDEEVWERKEHRVVKESENSIKTEKEMVKQINGKQCLLYSNWLRNPQVKSYSCKKVQKVIRDGKDVFMSTNEKKMVLTNGFLFVIDIENCGDKDYAIIDSRYNYESIESVKEAGKDYIYMVILLNKEGQKRKLLFNVSQRDECITELRNRVK